MSKRRRRMSSAPAGAGAETSKDERSESARGGAEAPAGAWRGRPGRRTTEDRTQAVVALLSGKASVDQLAARYGVQASTVEGWRQLALAGIEGVLRQGTAKSTHEVELQRELADVRAAFTDLAIRHELLARALKDRPSQPARSHR